jgi:hypothetical protein
MPKRFFVKESVILEHELVFLKFKKFKIWTLEKFEKNTRVQPTICSTCVWICFTKYLVFFSQQKWQNFRSGNTFSDLGTCSKICLIYLFCGAYNTRYFIIRICTIIVYIVGYIHVFFLEFFTILKMWFKKNSNKGLHSAWVPKRFFVKRAANHPGCIYHKQLFEMVASRKYMRSLHLQ